MEPNPPSGLPEDQTPPEPPERAEMIDQYARSWEQGSASNPRRERLILGRQHISTMTFRSAVLYPDPIMAYIAVLPLLLLGVMLHNALYGASALVWIVESTALMLIMLLNWMIYNRFRRVRQAMRRKNLLHEPMALWQEDLGSLEGQRRRHANALLGVRPMLLTLIRATSLDIDLEQEDAEIAYMVKKLIHAEEFDDALREKIYLYLVRVTFLIQKNAPSIELIMSLAAESHAEELAGVERIRLLSTKTVKYRDPKSIYQDFLSGIA